MLSAFVLLAFVMFRIIYLSHLFGIHECPIYRSMRGSFKRGVCNEQETAEKRCLSSIA